MRSRYRRGDREGTAAARSSGALRGSWRSRRRTRRDLELLVRERTAELELAIEQMESADTIIDRWTLEGVILSMNQFGLDTLGYEWDEVVGKRAMGSIVPDEPERLAEWVAVREELEANPERNVHSELQCRRKDGSPVWVAFRNRPILGADNRIVEVFSVGIDVTERRLRETRLAAVKQRMEDELGIGRQIQLSLLPRSFPEKSRLTLHADLEPAREVSGDFYDFFFLGDRHLYVCIGDVSDKGVPAALYMAVAKTLINSRAGEDRSPALILTHVNEVLTRQNDQSMFVTVFLALLDTETGEMEYVNAGHSPPLLRRPTGSVSYLGRDHGPAAGIIPGFVYRSHHTSLEQGDVLVMFTDGVTEAMDPNEVALGEERLVSLVRAGRFGGPKQLTEEIFAAVAAHTGPRERSDDAAVLALEYRGNEGAPSRRIRLSIESRMEAIGPSLDRVDGWMVDRELPDSVRRDVLLVLDDLLNNVVSHGYPRNTAPIEVTIERSADWLTLTIADEGHPFDPFASPPPDLSPCLEERPLGGIGIHLIRSVMDEHEYRREQDRNIVRVARRLAARDEEVMDEDRG